MKTTTLPLRALWWVLFLAMTPFARALPSEPPIVRILAPSDGSTVPLGDVVAIAGEVVDQDGYVTHFEYFVDGQLIGQETLNFLIPPPPGQVQQFKWPWRDATAGAHTITVLATDDQGISSKAGVGIHVGGVNPENVTLVKAGSVWRYHAKNVDLGAEWSRPEYPDSDWTSGPAQLGFGDGDEATVVPATKPLQPTVYFRREFQVPADLSFQSLWLRLLRDDGAVVWLNGKQILSDNMPGPASFSSLALDSSGPDENAWHEHRLSAEHLLAGRNVLAVEVHQASLTSSDLSFDLELIAGLPPALPVVSIEATNPSTGEPCPTCRYAPGVFTLRRTGDAKESLLVALRIAGTATPDKDYAALPEKVEFAAGESTVVVRVGAYDDVYVEGDETVVAELAYPPTNALPRYALDPERGRATVVIHDDETGGAAPVVSIEATRPETREPFLCKTRPCPLLPEPAPAVFTVRREGGDLKLPLSVALGFSGTALPEKDYSVAGPEALIPAGATAVEVWIAALPDEVVEGDETVIAQILVPPTLPDGVPPYRVAKGEAKVVIHDFTPNPNPVPVVSIEATQPNTSEPCPACLVLPGVFTISRTGDTVNPLSVMISFSGTATAGVDYEKLPSFIEIPAGQGSIQVKVLARLDNLAEGEESVVATLEADPTDGPVPHYTVDGNKATATVLIHDPFDSGMSPVVCVTVSRPETSECPVGALCKIPPVEILFHRTSQRLSEELTVWIGWKGTATWPDDYQVYDDGSLPSQVRFAAGSESAELLLNALTDCVIEGTEEVVVSIEPDPSLGPIERYRVDANQGSASISILDGSKSDDATLPVVGIRALGDTVEFCPPDADCREIDFVLTRTGGDLSQALEVLLTYSGSATMGVDYTLVSSAVTFPAGQKSVALQAGAINDALVEENETVIATLTCSDAAVPGYRIDGTLASATVKIIDNDRPVADALVEILEPKSGAVFSNPDSIQFLARTVDPKGAITRLDWFDGETKIGESEIYFIREPDPGSEIRLEFTWKNPPVGDHRIQAVGVSATGMKVVGRVSVQVVREGVRPVVTVAAGLAETYEVPPGSKRVLIPATFILKRSGSVEHPLKALYAVGGTAKNGRDYSFLDGDATFAAGESERVIYVSPITDELLEGDETVEFSLIRDDAYSIGQPGVARVVIHDAQQPTSAQITWVDPQEGSHFETGYDIKLVVTTVDPGGYFGHVDFFADGKVIGSADLIICAGLGCEPQPGTPVPFTFPWRNAGPGKYTLTAAAYDASGKRVESSPIHITVEPGGGRSFVNRSLPRAYQSGAPFTVVLKAKPAPGSAAYGMEDHPPKGWLVGSLGESGAWDPSRNAVKFGPFLDDKERVLTYEVTPPAGFVDVATFAGTASLDGFSSVIGGDQSVGTDLRPHPTDRNPADGSLSLDEVTAYGAAWKNGAAWPSGPNPIPIDYVTRAGALWRGGELYVYDPAAGAPPLCWVNVGTDGVRPEILNLDLPPADLAKSLLELRNRKSFASAELISGDAGVTLRIRTAPGTGVRAQAVEQYVTAAATVREITEGGVFDAQRGVIRWGPFYDDAPRTLSALIGHSDAAGVSGAASFDGEPARVALAAAVDAGAVAGPRIAEVRPLADGTMQVFVVDVSAGGCVLEASDDLVTWRRISEAAPGADRQVHQDTDANESARRFYRALPRP